MNILHIAPLSMKLSAGPTYSVPSYVNAQNSLDGIKSEVLISIKNKKREKGFYYLEDFNNKELLMSFLKSYDIIVFHSTYIIEHIKIARTLKRMGIPYIIVPRGGFTKGAKQIKKWKKKLGDFLGFKHFFESAQSIQFLTSIEQRESVHTTRSDFILPNGIKKPVIRRVYSNKNSIRIIFVGRIDTYHKGLDLLVNAVSLIKDEMVEKNVTIELYGPDVRNSKQLLNDQIRMDNTDNIVKIKQEVFLEEKAEILSSADIFIQTSRFEGLPMGVLEALSYGVPCILTPGTNMSREVNDFYAGIEVMGNAESISSGILDMIDKLENEETLGENAVKLANNYLWETIAIKSIEEYSKTLKRFEFKRQNPG